MWDRHVVRVVPCMCACLAHSTYSESELAGCTVLAMASFHYLREHDAYKLGCSSIIRSTA
jgi:hypothetical protein